MKFYMLSDATFYDRNNTVYLSWIKMSILGEYGAFKTIPLIKALFHFLVVPEVVLI